MSSEAETTTGGSGTSAVAGAFRSAMVEVLGEPPTPPNVAADLLRAHFDGADPSTLPAVTEKFSGFFHLNLQVALDEFLAEEGRSHEIVGLFSPSSAAKHESSSLSALLQDPSFTWAPVVVAPAEYELVKWGNDTMACIRQGMVLFHDADGPGAIWFRGYSVPAVGIVVDVAHASAEKASDILARLRERGNDLNPYRGHIVDLGLEFHMAYPRRIRFLPRPEHTEAHQVILPAGLLEQIEEHSIDVVKARKALKHTGRHLKRGILLHGRPGTGKTHTIRYLVSQIPDATVLLVSAEMAADIDRVNLVYEVIDVIQPGIVIFDDVDFIAEDRSLPGMTATRDSLFSLLELLDGIDEDADLLFVLTTNRPNMIEPAVAARPGRIDQAIEVPLPDADCRRRLVELYTRELTLEASTDEIEQVVERTEGVTASFVREIVRRAAARFVVRDGVKSTEPVLLKGADLLAALDELLDPDNPLTSLLLGAEPDHAKTALLQITTPDS